MRSLYVAKSAVTDALIDSDELANVGVTFGHPGNEAEQENVFLGGLDDSDESWSALGGSSIQEKYAISLYIQVHTPGNDAREACERACALYVAASNVVYGIDHHAIATDGFSFPSPFSLRPRDYEEFFGGDFQGRVVQVKGAVLVEARLSVTRG